MAVLDALTIEEKRLGKLYDDWNDFEKTNFIMNSNIGDLNLELKQIILKADSEVELLKRESLNIETNTKVEKYITVKELIDFMKKNYNETIWNRGISVLAHKYPYFYNGSLRYNLWKILVGPVVRGLVHEIRIDFSYKYDDGSHRLDRQKRIYIGKRIDEYYITSDNFNLEQQKEIFSILDCQKIYDYCMGSDFPKFTINGIYNFEGKQEELPISVENHCVSVGLHDCSDSCGICYTMSRASNKLTEIEQEVQENGRPQLIHAKAKKIYMNDSNYLDHIYIHYNDLPLYVQENLYKYKNENNQETGEKVNLLKRIFNRK